MTQTELSRANAATGYEWQKPGVRVVDPVTGAAFRYLEKDEWADDNADHQDEMCWAGDYPNYTPYNEAKKRAIAAGPDWQDDATAGVLLGLMPLVRISTYTNEGVLHWLCGWDNEGDYETAQTRNEAIARAYLASKGGTCT